MEISNSVIVGFILGGVAIPTGLVRVVWTLLNGKIEAGDKALLAKIEDGQKLLVDKMAELFQDTNKCEKILHKKVDKLTENTVDSGHCALRERLAILRFEAIEKESDRRFEVIDNQLGNMLKENSDAHSKLEGNDEKNHECLVRIDQTIAVMANNQKKRMGDSNDEDE